MVAGGGQASRTGEMPPSTARLWRDDSGEMTLARLGQDIGETKHNDSTCTNEHV